MESGRVRIISGDLGGRFLRFPSEDSIRPTSGRVRESLFSALVSRVDISGLRVLDLFAGSGALGFEALSRGAASAVFVEKNPLLAAALRENALALNLQSRTEVCVIDAAKWLAAADSPSRIQQEFDLVFADPPYHAGYTETLLQGLREGQRLATGAHVFLECAKDERPKLAAKDASLFHSVVERGMGDTNIFLYRFGDAGPEDNDSKNE